MNAVTKIKNLLEALQTCDPDGRITLSLDGALLYEDEQPGEVEYGFDPIIDCLHSEPEGVRSDLVYFRLSPDDTERILANRRVQTEVVAETLAPSVVPSIVTNAPVAVAIAISQDTYTNLLTVVDGCNRAAVNNHGGTTHGQLDVSKLLAMLAEDAAMTNSRPGSWEGANLQNVLDSHGYA